MIGMKTNWRNIPENKISLILPETDKGFIWDIGFIRRLGQKLTRGKMYVQKKFGRLDETR